MIEIRSAVESDAEQIAIHRQKMFLEMGVGDEETMQAMTSAFVPWVRQRLADGRYLGWIVWDGQVSVGGAGMFLMDFPPHWLDPQPLRAYLLNFYVDPSARGGGVAFGLLKTAIAEAKARGIGVVSLHASAAGRPIYERNGFEPTNEMMLRMEPS